MTCRSRLREGVGRPTVTGHRSPVKNPHPAIPAEVWLAGITVVASGSLPGVGATSPVVGWVDAPDVTNACVVTLARGYRCLWIC